MNTKPIKVESMDVYIEKHPSFTGCLINKKGDMAWFKNGKCHREDEPAFEDSKGYKAWYKNGVLHRENGPAIEYSDGGKAWYKNGVLHRENGPALIFPDGTKRWYLNGSGADEKGYYTEQTHHLAVRRMKLKMLDKVVT
jgi:hypothetical protein